MVHTCYSFICVKGLLSRVQKRRSGRLVSPVTPARSPPGPSCYLRHWLINSMTFAESYNFELGTAMCFVPMHQRSVSLEAHEARVLTLLMCINTCFYVPLMRNWVCPSCVAKYLLALTSTHSTSQSALYIQLKPGGGCPGHNRM